MFDVIFFVDALPETGFGHGARCLILAQLIAERRPEVSIVFRGLFSEGAIQRLSSAWPGIDLGPVNKNETARLGVIDRMADSMDMNATDKGFNQRVAATCDHVVYVASGVVAPHMPDGVLVVGYQPGAQQPAPNVLWSLDFAPTNLAAPTHAREPDRLLIALGGIKENSGLTKALTAAARVSAFKHIDVLLSPVIEETPDHVELRDDQNIAWHRNIPDVAPLIERAGMVLVSAGNLAYEALALGAPVCLIGQKPFQLDLAEGLAARNMAVNAGLLSEITVEELVLSLEDTLGRSETLSALSAKQVPINGLPRLVETILAYGDLS